MSLERVVVATRKSKLALVQTRAWIKTLEEAHPGLAVEELHVTTSGDRIQDRALREVGGKGLFIKEIEEALLEGRAHVAVHSMKDVPAELAPGLSIGCVPEREDPRDVLVTRSGGVFESLPPGSRIGTSSLRRGVQLAAWRPDVEIVSLRGNVDTRLKKCEEGTVDAIVLARSGLLRLGLAERATEVLDVERCLPAIGQGALAIERGSADTAVAEALAPLVHAETEVAVAAERGVQLAAEGSCDVPVAGFAVRDGGELWLRAFLAEADGARPRHREGRIPWPAEASEAHRFGVELGQALKAG